MASIARRRTPIILLSLCLSFVAVTTRGQTHLPAQADASSAAGKLAARLVAAGSDQERQALLAAEKELLSVELRKALIGQGEALRTKGNYPQAQAALELAQLVAEQIDDRVGIADAWNAFGTLRIYQSNFSQFRLPVALAPAGG